MGCTNFILSLPTDYTEEKLRSVIKKKVRSNFFTYKIEKKSLDARKKNNINWQVNVLVTSPNIKSDISSLKNPKLQIPYRKNRGDIIVVGIGPAGFFASLVLQLSGFKVTIIEQGTDVDKRLERIKIFEETKIFDPLGNYVFGEGGAGTFSDGKLTSRTKKISAEKDFIISHYISAGAPKEIEYLSHPHIGSDNLIKIVKNLRSKFEGLGGRVIFETTLKDLVIKNNKVIEVVTSAGNLRCDYLFIAPGHSSNKTYKMLIKNNVQFRTKNFAIGTRMEHPQELINEAQWGKKQIKGLKSAEYRLTSNTKNLFPVYSFCMCPGGTIVPSATSKDTNIVNGMSNYLRNGEFANAACVAGININELLNRKVSAIESLNWLESLERSFFNHSKGFEAPSCTIEDFINNKYTTDTKKTTYTFGLKNMPLWELFHKDISNSIKFGLKNFCRKIKGFETGILLGLESKTSSPIQVVREKNGLCTGFNNLYIIGEGSGFSGGIISSAVDGIKNALKLINSL